VRKVLSPLRAVLAPGADAVVLVKPQFEVGRGQVGRGGIVKDPELHVLALRTVAEAAIAESGYAVRGACASPIAGTEGNREFFLHLRPDGEGMSGAPLADAVERAVRG
jgi:23S rRNA (cytidine1920-2'-O)/16S rRNA (cytidine1409-2'-O)-methyltransferase